MLPCPPRPGFLPLRPLGTLERASQALLGKPTPGLTQMRSGTRSSENGTQRNFHIGVATARPMPGAAERGVQFVLSWGYASRHTRTPSESVSSSLDIHCVLKQTPCAPLWEPLLLAESLGSGDLSGVQKGLPVSGHPCSGCTERAALHHSALKDAVSSSRVTHTELAPPRKVQKDTGEAVQAHTPMCKSWGCLDTTLLGQKDPNLT